MKTLVLILALLASGCATTIDSDRDRAVIFGFGLTFAVISNKTTKAKTETADAEQTEEEG